MLDVCEMTMIIQNPVINCTRFYIYLQVLNMKHSLQANDATSQYDIYMISKTDIPILVETYTEAHCLKMYKYN